MLWLTLAKHYVNDCVTKCRLGASTIGNQLQDEESTNDYQNLTTQPWAPTPPRKPAPLTLINSGKYPAKLIDKL